jgi:hypothetical protein
VCHNNVKKRKIFIGFNVAAEEAENIIVKCTSDTTNTEFEEQEEEAIAPLDEDFDYEGITQLVWEWAVLN